MLQSFKQLKTLVLTANDGDIGRSKDFLFDDRAWVTRYMVVDTSKWLSGKKVLISPTSLGRPDQDKLFLPVHLSKEQLKKAPDLHSDAPVSRQYEIAFHTFYGMPFYWDENSASDLVAEPSSRLVGKMVSGKANEHLRSVDEICGYRVVATDGECGVVEDFILDDEAWDIQYLIVRISASKSIQLSPAWMGDVNWGLGLLNVHMTKEQLESNPEYNSALLIET
jgi:sporulation protein YlmC with PRC-barrel domain